ncbi:MAG TPA: ATP-binding protein [Candidatus Wallbacteria bacterium]|nr:ATP-binding protein [Candidatus Wallbacteria bacterium]
MLLKIRSFMKIEQKLTLSFILILLIFAAFGIITIFEIHTMKSMFSQIKKQDIGATDILDKLVLCMDKIRILEGELVLTRDEKNLNNNIKEINSTINSINDKIIKYKALAETDNEELLFTQFETAFKRFVKYNEELILQKTSGTTPLEKLELFLNDFQASFDKMVDIIDSIIKLEYNDAFSRVERSIVIYEDTRYRITLIFTILIIFGTILAFYLVERFSRIYFAIDENLKIEILKNKTVDFFKDQLDEINIHKLLYLISNGLECVSADFYAKIKNRTDKKNNFSRISLNEGVETVLNNIDGRTTMPANSFNFLLTDLEIIKEPLIYDFSKPITNFDENPANYSDEKKDFLAYAKSKKIITAVIYPIIRNGDVENIIGLYFAEGTEYIYRKKLKYITDIISHVSLLIDNFKLINELKSKNELLFKQNGELDAYARTVSHDLKNPLSAVSGYLQMIISELHKEEKPNIEKISKFSENSLHAANSMEHLINDILNLSRIKNLALDIKKVDIKSVVNGVIKLMDEKIKKANVEISVQGELPVINADLSCMERAISNLFSNSIKYMGNGNKRHISFSYSESSDFYTFTHSDTGCGIAKQYHSNIFMPFYRTREEAEVDGTGVGLSIVKSIVERHGGKIWFESSQGAGTTFYFTISKNLGQ